MVTIPAMLGLTALAIVFAPILLPAAIVYDVVRLRWRFPSVRVACFLLQYVLNDSLEIVLSPIFWVMAGFGRRLDTAASIRRHERLQKWSVDVLARRADRLLGIRLDLTPAAERALSDARAIVLCRHVSLFDATLPALLLQRQGHCVRGVILAELLADPGFDLLYGRLGSVFVVRESGSDALAAIAKMAAGLDASTVAVIFPEGRLFRPAVLERSLARLVERDPERAERLRSLRHVLPVRSGGTMALLAGAPTADLVVLVHVGLDEFSSFKELALAVPLKRPILVDAWRVARADIPGDPVAQARWLDDQWIRADNWVASHL